MAGFVRWCDGVHGDVHQFELAIRKKCKKSQCGNEVFF